MATSAALALVAGCAEAPDPPVGGAGADARSVAAEVGARDASSNDADLSPTLGGDEQRDGGGWASDTADAGGPEAGGSEPTPTYPGSTWERAEDPAALGWSAEALDAAESHSKTKMDTTAVVIVEGGIIVDGWGELEKPHECRSMRKSFLSLLFGQPVSDGSLDLEATLGELAIDDDPPLTSGELQAKVVHLLTSTSGVYHPANYETATQRAERPERGSHAPGTFFYYNNWDFNALGTIYAQTTGETVFDAFDRQIAEPLQLEHHSRENMRWSSDGSSIHPAYTFRMSPLDQARIGLLVLRKGRWNGKVVVPEDWVDTSTAPLVDTGGSSAYGYMWWVRDMKFDTLGELRVVRASGSRGQRILVIPQRDLVVVHAVDTADDGEATSGEIDELLEMILLAKP